MKVSLLACGGGDIYYELGLLSGLITKEIYVDFIGSDFMQNAGILSHERVSFYNLRRDQDPNVLVKEKFFRIIKFYIRLIKYAFTADSFLFHIQWLNKFTHFDRMFLNIYYKILGKKLIYTAHNVNAGVRNEKDTILNRFTLKFMYKIVDHIIVHTNKMKHDLINDFKVRENKVTVIPYGINDLVFKSDLTPRQARKKLNIDINERILLFFGIITPYKGIEYLLMALASQIAKKNVMRLIIAGKIDRTAGKYWQKIEKIIDQFDLYDYIIRKIEFIPDEDIEVYFKAADVLILPYKFIYQSGPLFLSYNFGLPVIATDVGSFSEDIMEGTTGFLCRPEDPEDLEKTINMYAHSDLYKNLKENREKIEKYASDKYSWEKIGDKTLNLYKSIQ